MVHTEFPNLQWLKSQAEQSFAARKAWNGRVLAKKGWPTVILNVKTNNAYRDNIRGPLSVFSNIRGESVVEASKRRVKVKEGFFFVTNHDEYYTLQVDQRNTETFNIHFGEYFADQV